MRKIIEKSFPKLSIYVSEIINYINETKELLNIRKSNFILNAVRKALEAICNDTIKREEIKIEAKNPHLNIRLMK